MKTNRLKPLCLAVGLALAAPAFALNLDFSGSNIYMKFLDGNRRIASQGAPNTESGSADTASGTDQGQWTEFEWRIKATLSRQVEAGIRLQSRSSDAYWTDYGGFGDQELTPTRANYIKLRGAYIQLTPGYGWLDQALLGSSDWGMFDPFTVGKVRYIDRDNYKGLYFKGNIYGGVTWDAARISLPNYLQFNYGQGSACCASDASQFNEAVYIAQFKKDFGTVARIAASVQAFNDHEIPADNGNDFDGRRTQNFGQNRVFMLKGETSPITGLDLRGAFYRSTFRQPLFDQPWIGNPKSDINDKAYKFDADISLLPVTFSLQYFNIGAGYYSNMAPRRESDVLLTEGSEAAWFNWGQSIWLGGAAADLQQTPATPHCFVSGGGVCRSNPGLAAGANGIVDNAFMDFDEPPAESVLGWKGFTGVARYEIANTPLFFEATRIGYNNNWRNYSPTGPLSNFYPLDQDRSTTILVFKATHTFPIWGGIDTSFKWKRVADKDNATDVDPGAPYTLGTRDTKDNGITLGVGNQLFSSLYGSLSWGRYTRDIKLAAANFDNNKKIWSVRLAYNLPGFELGWLTQWINGRGDPLQTGTPIDIRQYRLKAYAKAMF